MKIIDLSQPIENGMPVYPGDSVTTIKQMAFFNKDKYNNHSLDIQMHAGTHIDGKMHMLDCTKYIDDYPIDSFVGKGCIIDARGRNIVELEPQYKSVIRERSIVLVYTGMDEYYGQFRYYHEHPVLSTEFCRYLISMNVKMVGMDMPSPDRSPFDIHKLLLTNNILILENLTNLNQIIIESNFEVFAMPLKIKADSCIARVAVRLLE
jgi:kynurenine formamidase